VNGRRITDAKTLEVAKMVYGGKINLEILSALRNSGARGVGLSGIDANLIVAKKRDPVQVLNRETGTYEEVDFGYVGDIIEVNVDIIEQLLEGGYIPVVACLGADMEGNIYNINADTVAEKIAVGIKADKLINVTNVRGILRDVNDERSLISFIDVEEAQTLVESGVVSEGMIPKVQTCIAAVQGGVKRTCLIDGTNRNALLIEVFTHEGHGTMIVSVEEKARYQAEELAASDERANVSVV
jgi:acetylglutamate kinase